MTASFSSDLLKVNSVSLSNFFFLYSDGFFYKKKFLNQQFEGSNFTKVCTKKIELELVTYRVTSQVLLIIKYVLVLWMSG